VNLASVNSPSTENTPELAKNGLSLYFGSPRPGGSGSNDLWVARRHCADLSDPACAWQTPVNLGGLVNSIGIDAGPELTRDGLTLFFTSATNAPNARPGGHGSNDLYVTTRPCTDAVSCPWAAAGNLGPPVNTPGFEGGPSLWGPELYFNRGNVPGAPDVGTTPSDIYVSRIDGGLYGVPTPVDSLNSLRVDQRPSIRFDGREIFLASDRDGGLGSHDIWVSTRQNNGHATWAVPLNLGSPINTEFEENHPSISPDGTMLFFASRRPSSPGEDCSATPTTVCDLDLYVVTRIVLGKE
jgi:hypothetical protein